MSMKKPASSEPPVFRPQKKKGLVTIGLSEFAKGQKEIKSLESKYFHIKQNLKQAEKKVRMTNVGVFESSC